MTIVKPENSGTLKIPFKCLNTLIMTHEPKKIHKRALMMNMTKKFCKNKLKSKTVSLFKSLINFCIDLKLASIQDQSKHSRNLDIYYGSHKLSTDKRLT